MTELETMQRAKMYLEKLSRGIDPITDREMPEDSVLNNVRICRCLHYVTGILDQVIANGGVVGKKAPKPRFVITRERLSGYRFSEQSVRITEFVELLWNCAADPEMKKPSTTVFTNWLLEKGLLCKEMGPDGKNRRVPTDAGYLIGMSLQSRQGQYGEYTAVCYNESAQRFLLDHMEEILGA